ncbi:hypothetical protein KAH37_05770 [bacterium]|nr:hypothetical protein [bacterium]
MRAVIFLFVIATFVAPLSLMAKQNGATVRLCFQKDDNPFTVATQSKKIAIEKGFIPYKDGYTYMMNMRVYVDGVPHTYVKPYNESCVSLFRIPSGKHTISASFRAVTYTTLRVTSSYTKKFRNGLLYEPTLEVTQGSMAHIVLKQISNKIQVYESLTNNPIPHCETSCDIPTSIPIYFKARDNSQKIPCPTDYLLTVKSEKEKNLPCYSDKEIQAYLHTYVKKENILCKPDIEKAYFRIFGEGCLISLESDRNGLNYLPPMMKIIPASERKFHYFLTLNDAKKKYKFNEQKTGKKITPEMNQEIIFSEEKKTEKQDK